MTVLQHVDTRSKTVYFWSIFVTRSMLGYAYYLSYLILQKSN